jgi:predicted nucleotidyltransferase
VGVVQGREGVSIAEIVSFRGRFCEQARKGERVVAAGTLERVEFSDGSFMNRLLLGNAKEDFMTAIDI